MQYQPNYVKGVESGEHQRGCSERYALIKNYLNYTRPISVIDIGANYGYFSFRLAEDFDASCVLVDSKPIEKLIDKNGTKLVWLNHRINTSELSLLSRSESFDVVLALSVVHHFKDWMSAVDSIINLGQTVIFEIPGKDDQKAVGLENHKAISDYVLNKPHEKIADVKTHLGSTRPLIAIKGNDQITRQSMDAELRDAPAVKVDIFSKPDSKRVSIKHKQKAETRNFIHGINLWNYKLLHGHKDVEPLLRKCVREMDGFHDDLRPWNFIFDGKKIHAIDFNNKLWRKEPEKNGLEKCLSLLKMSPDYTNPEFTGLFRTA